MRQASPARSAMLSKSALSGLLGGLFGDADPALGGGAVDIFNVPEGWVPQNECWVSVDLWAGAPRESVPTTNGVPWKHRIAFPRTDNSELANYLDKNKQGYGYIPAPIPAFLRAGWQYGTTFLVDQLDVRALRGDKLPRDAFGGGMPSWWGEEEQSRFRNGGDLNWQNDPPRAGSLSVAPVVTSMRPSPGGGLFPALVMPISGFVEGLTVGAWNPIWADKGRCYPFSKAPCDFWSADGSSNTPICFSPFGYPIDLISYWVAKIPSDQMGKAVTGVLEEWLRAWGYLKPPQGYPPGLGGITVYDVELGATSIRNAGNKVYSDGGVSPQPELPPSEDVAPDGGMVDPFAPSDGGASLPPEAAYPDAYGLLPGQQDPGYYDPSYNPAYPQSQGYQDGFPVGSGGGASLPSANEAAFDLAPQPAGVVDAELAALRLSDLSVADLEALGLWVDDQGFVHDAQGSYLDDEGYPVLDAAGNPIETDAEPALEEPLPFSVEGDEPIAPYAGESWG